MSLQFTVSIKHIEYLRNVDNFQPPKPNKKPSCR